MVGTQCSGDRKITWYKEIHRWFSLRDAGFHGIGNRCFRKWSFPDIHAKLAG